MNIEKRVFLAIEAGGNGKFEIALSMICPAIEATARKSLCRTRISGNDYKNFLRKYTWLVENFGGAGIDFEKTRFLNAVVESDDNKIIFSPDFADIIYHIFRCSSAHGHTIPEGFQLIPSPTPGIRQTVIDVTGKTIRFPESMLWSLVACVVFCSANKDIVTHSTHHLTWGQGSDDWREKDYHFDIDVFWGAEDIVRRFLDVRAVVKVELKMPNTP